MSLNSDCLLLIPAFNEEGRIGQVIHNCKSYFSSILVVDDGSNDNTNKEANSAGPELIIKHCINCGQGTALKTGIKYFLNQKEKKYLVTFDADGQHSPADANKMVKFAVDESADIVFGTRFNKSNNNSKIPIKRKVLLQLARLYERIFFQIKLTDSHNGLRVISKNACRKLININSSSMAHATEIASILSKSEFKIHELPCTILYDVNNKKSQSIFTSMNIISDLIQKK